MYCINNNFYIDNNNSRNCCMIFIDEDGRVYQNWKNYVEYNNLPDSYIVAPKNGIYNSDDMDNVIIFYFLIKHTEININIFNVFFLFLHIKLR